MKSRPYVPAPAARCMALRRRSQRPGTLSCRTTTEIVSNEYCMASATSSRAGQGRRLQHERRVRTVASVRHRNHNRVVRHSSGDRARRFATRLRCRAHCAVLPLRASTACPAPASVELHRAGRGRRRHLRTRPTKCKRTEARPGACPPTPFGATSCAASTDRARFIAERAVSHHSTAVHGNREQMNKDELVSLVAAGTPVARADTERLVGVLFSAILPMSAYSMALSAAISTSMVSCNRWPSSANARQRAGSHHLPIPASPNVDSACDVTMRRPGSSHAVLRHSR